MRKGFHPDWKSYVFNYGRNEVRALTERNIACRKKYLISILLVVVAVMGFVIYHQIPKEEEEFTADSFKEYIYKGATSQVFNDKINIQQIELDNPTMVKLKGDRAPQRQGLNEFRYVQLFL